VKLLYFAWLREKAGLAEEIVAPPPSVATVGALLAWLGQRGGGPAQALGDPACVRIAVNQQYAGLDHPVAEDDEVAFFPPVTGGDHR
jgi:molybdopterin synthase sulfur carrier subunit